MTTQYYPITVIGIKVPKDKIIITKEVIKNECVCNPQVNPTRYLGTKYRTKFCSQCGRLLRRIHVESFPKFDSIKDKGKVLEWPVANDTGAENFFIGVYSSGMVNYRHRGDIPDLSEKTVEKFKKDMKSLDLWDEKEFGIWTILCVSY